MTTVLVTGGAGYIGRHAAAALQEAGRSVVILDNFSTGGPVAAFEQATVVAGDAGDQALVAALIKEHGISAIMHFAAFVDVEESTREPDKYRENNFHATERLLKQAEASGVSHFIFSSTAAVYGNPSVIPVPEDASINPVSPYGQWKWAAEQVVRTASRTSSLRHAILRYFNVAGCDPRGRFGYKVGHATHLIRRAVAVALGREACLPIYGSDYPTPDGTAVRDYIHVTDLVAAHLAALEHLERGGASDTYNVGYGKGYSVLEVHAATERVTGQRIPTRLEPRRSGDPAIIVADATKLRRELGWQPSHDNLEEMIRSQYEWERSQT